MFVPVRTPSQVDAVADVIRTQIQLGRLQPGQVLPGERRMSEEFGVSRSTVREAVRILTSENYLDPDPRGHRGASVALGGDARIDMVLRALKRESEIREALVLRLALEPGAARLAAARIGPAQEAVIVGSLDDLSTAVESMDPLKFRTADMEFHQAIAQATGNEWIISTLTQARAKMFYVIDVLQPDLAYKRTADAHAAIWQRLASRESATAEELMRTHIEETIDEVDAAMDQWRSELPS